MKVKKMKSLFNPKVEINVRPHQLSQLRDKLHYQHTSKKMCRWIASKQSLKRKIPIWKSLEPGLKLCIIAPVMRATKMSTLVVSIMISILVQNSHLKTHWWAKAKRKNKFLQWNLWNNPRKKKLLKAKTISYKVKSLIAQLNRHQSRLWGGPPASQLPLWNTNTQTRITRLLLSDRKFQLLLPSLCSRQLLFLLIIIQPNALLLCSKNNHQQNSRNTLLLCLPKSNKNIRLNLINILNHRSEPHHASKSQSMRSQWSLSSSWNSMLKKTPVKIANQMRTSLSWLEVSRSPHQSLFHFKRNPNWSTKWINRHFSNLILW